MDCIEADAINIFPLVNFYSEDQINWWLERNSHIIRFVSEIIVPSDAIITVEENCFKSTSVISGEVKEIWLDEDLSLMIVRKRGRALENVIMKTEYLCLEAVRQDGHALEFVPDSFFSEEMCVEAVKQNGYAVYWVPLDYQTKRICLEAFKQNKYSIQWIRNDIQKEISSETTKKLGRLENLFADLELGNY